MLPLPLLQVPKLPWHPAPQWAVVLPQLPVDEQHVPNAEPVHVLPLEEPHLPSVEMLPLPLLHVPKPDWHPAPQWSAVPPQYPFAEQQSPNPDPPHFLPLTLLHRPSLDTSEGAEHVPKPDWHPAPQWAVVSPQ